MYTYRVLVRAMVQRLRCSRPSPGTVCGILPCDAAGHLGPIERVSEGFRRLRETKFRYTGQDQK